MNKNFLLNTSENFTVVLEFLYIEYIFYSHIYTKTTKISLDTISNSFMKATTIKRTKRVHEHVCL